MNPLVNCLEGPLEPIVKLAFSDRHLALCSQDNYLYIVDLEPFAITQRFEFTDTVTWAQFYSNNLLVACALDGTIAYFQLADNCFKQVFSTQCSALYQFVIAKKKIYAISEDSLIYILNGNDLSFINSFPLENVNELFYYDNKILFAGNELLLYDCKSYSIADRFQRTNSYFTSVYCFNDNILTGNDTGDLYYLKERNGKIYFVQKLFEEDEQVLCFYQVSVNNFEILMVGRSNSLVCLEKSLQERYCNYLNVGIIQILQYKEKVICGCSDGGIAVFDALSGNKICNFEAVVQENEQGEEVQNPVFDMAIFGNRLFVTGDKYVYVYQLNFEEIGLKQYELEQNNELDDQEAGGEIGRIE